MCVCDGQLSPDANLYVLMIHKSRGCQFVGTIDNKTQGLIVKSTMKSHIGVILMSQPLTGSSWIMNGRQVYFRYESTLRDRFVKEKHQFSRWLKGGEKWRIWKHFRHHIEEIFFAYDEVPKAKHFLERENCDAILDVCCCIKLSSIFLGDRKENEIKMWSENKQGWRLIKCYAMG